MEKFIPFQNKDGQIQDIEIARKMAEAQKTQIEEYGSTVESSDDAVETWGRTDHAEKMTPAIVEKLRSVLTKEEFETIKEIGEDPLGQLQAKFFELISEEEE